MLKRRIIPTLLLKDRMLVKGRQFNSWRVIGPVMPQVQVYERRQVDELMLLDIGATPQGRGPDLLTIARVADECSMPLTVGGGIRDLATIRTLLRMGADKVVIGTGAWEVDGLIEDASWKFGAQCITLAVDVHKHCGAMTRCGNWSPGMGPNLYMHQVGGSAAGEILLTSVDRDGTLEGYDLDLIRRVSAAVNIPVIASGGAGSYADFEAAFEAGAHAVAASSMYQWTDQTPLGAKQHLHERGVPVRL